MIEQEKMRELCLDQLEVLGKVDPGFPEWKGDILKHFSTAELNLARYVNTGGLGIHGFDYSRTQFIPI